MAPHDEPADGDNAGVFGLTAAGIGSDPAFGTREVTALVAADDVVWAVADRRSIARREPDGTWTDVARSSAESLSYGFQIHPFSFIGLAPCEQGGVTREP